MSRALNVLMALLLAHSGLSTWVAAETPPAAPLTADEQTRIGELALKTQAEDARLKAQLEVAQRKLAAVYATYELDAENASLLETDVLDLQRRLLTNHRQAQTELRKLAGKERFATFKRRLDDILEVPAADLEKAVLPSRDARGGAVQDAEPVADRSNGRAAELFSGPQAGEELPPLPVRGVYDEDAEKELDFVNSAAGKPIVLVFIHEMNRPTIGMTRALTAYTQERAKDGLTTGIVWLDDDATEAENTLKRIRHALTPGVPIGVSPDGKEGPGSYGLNRNVALTILVGDKGRVTANFALVQPSIQADLPKVFAEIVRLVGGKAPKVADVGGGREAMRGSGAGEPDPRLRELVRPVIQLDATVEAVDRAATALESYLENNEVAQKEVGRIATTIVGSGKLSNYGTPRAQEYLRKWAEQFGGDRTSGEAPSPGEKSKPESTPAPSR